MMNDTEQRAEVYFLYSIVVVVIYVELAKEIRSRTNV